MFNFQGSSDFLEDKTTPFLPGHLAQVQQRNFAIHKSTTRKQIYNCAYVFIFKIKA